MTDKQLLRICKSFRDGILDGRPAKNFCFMVSAALQGYLGASGIGTMLIEGEYEMSDALVVQHFWLEMQDGRILDATADQFPLMPAVFLGQMPPFYKKLSIT